MFFWIEAGLTALAAVLAFTAPRLGARWFEAGERSFRRLADRRALSVIVVGLGALALRLALLPILPPPVPGVHDEFGYLLLADTFAHGRLTNPTNPMWVHFETFHVLWQPTYTAKYYPAQGLMMALGQAITGHPFWGVWLSVGIMCAAITWMLQEWVGPRWALLGGLLAAIRLGSFSYWANSYWGGAVAAIGGALVLGALPRLKKQPRVSWAVLMGLGFAILANSRPYEGLFFGLPVAGALLLWLRKLPGPDRSRALTHAMAPLLAVLALTLAAMGYYFWRTTGSPFQTPYLVYEHMYNPVPYFPWQRLKPFPVYRHASLEDYYGHFMLGGYERSQSALGLIGMNIFKGIELWEFYLGFALALPLVMALVLLPRGFAWKQASPGTRFLLLICGVTLAGEALPVWFVAHYAAPLTAAMLALVLIAMRRVRDWTWGDKPAGLLITRSVPAVCVLLLGVRVAAGAWHVLLPPDWPQASIPTWCWQSPSLPARQAMLRKLRALPGRALVIVHYSPAHQVHNDEWVYNRADLETAKVIWARDMGADQNQELIRYFRDRQVWLLEADSDPPKLLPYSGVAGRALAPPGKTGEAR